MVAPKESWREKGIKGFKGFFVKPLDIRGPKEVGGGGIAIGSRLWLKQPSARRAKSGAVGGAQ